MDKNTKNVLIILMFGIVLVAIFRVRKERLQIPLSMQSYPTDKSGAKISDEQAEARMQDPEYINPDDYYTTSDGKERVLLRNKLNKEQELVKTVSQSDRNFNVDYNHGLYARSQGWWQDVLDCKPNALKLYCKPSYLWIWPY